MKSYCWAFFGSNYSEKEIHKLYRNGLRNSCDIEQSFVIICYYLSSSDRSKTHLIPALVTLAKSDKLLYCASSVILVNMMKVSRLTSLHFLMLSLSALSNSCGSLSQQRKRSYTHITHTEVTKLLEISMDEKRSACTLTPNHKFREKSFSTDNT